MPKPSSTTSDHLAISPEIILRTLRMAGVPITEDALYQRLKIPAKLQQAFAKQLLELKRTGKILLNRKGALCIAEKLDLIMGKVQGHADGFGFLIPDDAKQADVFLRNSEMQQVLHGDYVAVQVTGTDRKGRPEGKIVEILERRTQQFVGRVQRNNTLTLVVAEDKRITTSVIIPPRWRKGAQDGQVVMVSLMEYPSRHTQAIGKITEVLGDHTDSGMEIEIALRKHQLPHVFDKATLSQANRYAHTVSKQDWAGRKDIRQLPLLTIDGETARDFDDAVYATPVDKGMRLVVAIADVSFYVQPNTALDKAAFERGNSVYFPRRVIPMLPSNLSDELCSLNQDVDRLCMVCDMLISSGGEVLSYQFYPSVMRSHARLTYTQVHNWLQGTPPPAHQAYLLVHLQHLLTVYQWLLKARHARGALEFESTDTDLLFDEQGKIRDIILVKRNEAHRLIEECMLCANVCSADFLQQHHHPSLYRVHEGPTAEKLADLRTFLSEFGLGLGGGDKPQPKDYATLIEKIQGRADAHLLQTVILRSMQQAVYRPQNEGHFGLAYEAYTHFTSPIRRYPDLLVHRAIKAVLSKTQYQPSLDWQKLGIQCSLTERRADEASREVTNWLKCFYMRDKIGEVFNGNIVNVTAFGLFIALDNVHIEGLLHIAELGNDYFHYNKIRHEIVGERSHTRYRLGDRLSVRLVRVSIETSRIDFALSEKNTDTPRHKRSKP